MPLAASASPPFKSKLILKRGLKAVKTLELGFGFTLARVAERAGMYEVAVVDFFFSFLPLLVLFYEGNLLFFFLNPIRVEWANIRNRRIKQFGSGHTAFILTWSFFVVVFSCHRSLSPHGHRNQICVSVFIHVLRTHWEFSTAWCVCDGAHFLLARQNPLRKSQQNNWVQLILSLQIDPKNN